MAGLDTEFRPSQFDEFHGNREIINSVLRILKNYKSNDRKNLPQAFLISGISGIGKTTLARIMSIELGVLDKESYADSSFNFTEYNTSDFRGIDLIRSIRQSLNLSPVGSPFRIWLLDECHRLTPEAQDGLLKCIEEPPRHAIFILATTNPEKLHKMLLRRCFQIELKGLDMETMESYAKSILKKVGIKSEIQSYIAGSISKIANGSPGVAIKYIERLQHGNQKKLSDKKYIAKLLATSTDIIEEQCINLCRALINTKTSWESVAKILYGLRESKEDPEGIRRAILGYCDSILLKKDHGRAGMLKLCFQSSQCNTWMDGFGAIITSSYAVFIQDED